MSRLKNILLRQIFILACPLFCFAQNGVDSLDLKIGQMIMMGINDRQQINDKDELVQEIKNNKLGGVVLFEKNISKENSKTELQNLIGKMQQSAKIPLIITIDEEGGKVHRLKEKYGFVSMPSAQYLGRLDNSDSTLFYNSRLASELKELGIGVNYAPCVDMAVNPANTVIFKNERSFSDQASIISKHASLCIKAHHQYGIQTILKHFPGHGSSTADSHLGIVDVTNTWDFKELFPYYDIIKSGNVDAIMTAHIINRNWDKNQLPATLSVYVVNGMLRGWLGFKGVVFSDDMQMHAISKNYGFENAIELAINAGVDVLMFANNVKPDEKTITATEVHSLIKKLVSEGKIPKSRINEAYSRIMILKSKNIRS